MQKFLRTLTLMALMLVPWVTQAQTLTVADGTETNEYVPFYGYWADAAQHNQVLYPAADLTAMVGKNITQMVFHVSSYSYYNDWGTWTVSLGETSATSLSGLDNATTLTQVFSGAFEATMTSTTLTITFDDPYTYNGGNLLLDINHPAGNYSQCSFYGIEATGAAYCYDDQRNFLPKTTFSYETPSACAKPNALAVQLTPGNGTVATLSWNETGTATTWQICLNDDETNLINATTNPYQLTGLTAEQAYTAKVRANCGGSQSAWSNPISFTPTNAYSITVNDGTSTNGYVPIYGYYCDNYTKSQFVIPAADLAAMQFGHINKLTFYSSNASVSWGAAQFEVYVTETSATGVSAMEDLTSMTQVLTASSLSINGNQMEVTLTTPYQYMGGNLLIAFNQPTSGSYVSCSWFGVSASGASMGGYGSSVSQQNFLPKMTIEYTPGVAPSCMPLSGLAVNYTGGTTATVSWTSDATAWNIDINGTVTPITTNPYTITGLNLSTTYIIKVQADCGANGTSDWTNTVSFTTPDCWGGHLVEYSLTDSYGDGWEGATITLEDACGNVLETLTTTGSTVNGTLSLCGDYYKFVHHNGTCCGSEHGWTFTESGATIFSGNGGSYGEGDVLFILGTNPCPDPTGLAAGALTVNSAVLSWTENGTATAWQLCVNGDETNLINVTSNPYTLTGLAENTDYTVKLRANCGEKQSCWTEDINFTTLANCPIPVLAANGITNVTAHTADVAWTGFSQNDSYVVRYRTASYFDGESEEFGTSLPSGWENKTGLLSNVMNGTALSTGSQWVFGSNNGVFDNHARINIYGTSRYGWLITPSVEVGTGYGLNFDLAFTAYSGTGAASGTCDDDRFVVLISTDNEATWSILREWNNSGSAYVYNNIALAGENVTIDLSAYAGQNVRVAFYGESTVSNGDNNMHIDNVGIGQMVPAGAWQTANAATTSTTLTGLAGETIYDVNVTGVCGGSEGFASETQQFTTEIACPATTNLTAGIPTPNSVELSWTENGTATAWQLCINGDEAHLVAATSNPFTLTGLSASTDYTVKVRANCGGIDGQSDWSNTVNFTTQANCPAPVFEATGITNVAAHTADVEWTGFTQNDSYVVHYRSQEYIDGMSEEFGTSLPTGWESKSGLLSNIMNGTAFSTATQWNFGSNNGVFDNHARINIYGTTRYGWLITPSVEVGTGFGLNFDLAFTAYSGTGAASGTCDDDRFVVLISTDNEATWSILREWNNSGSAYVYNNIALAGENVNIDLSAYAGQTVKIAFYGESTVTGNGDNNMHIDNVAIGQLIPAGAWQTASNVTGTSTTLTGLTAETPYEVKIEGICGGSPADEMSDLQVFTTLPSCMPVDGLAVSDVTTNSVTLTWTDNANTGATYTIYNVTDNNSIVASGVNATTYTVTGLTENTAYTFGVLPICQEGETTPVTVSTRTECAPKSLPWTCGFEADEIQSTTAATALPWCSYRKVESVSNPNHPYSTSGNAYNGSRSLYYYGTTGTTYPAVMAFILPQVNVASFPMNNNRVTFYAKMGAATNSKMVKAYTLTDPTDWSTAIEVPEASVTVSGNTYEKYSINLTNAEAAAAYVALAVERGTGTLYMDDLTLEVQPACLEVASVSVSDATANSVTLTWIDSDNEVATYTIYNMADESVIATNVAGASYTVTNLDANTAYTFGVMANCTNGNSPAVTTVATRTACEATTPLPYEEDFSDYTGLQSIPYNGPSTTPYCWDYYSNGTNTVETGTSAYYGGVAKYSSTSYGCMEANNPYLYLPIQLTGANVTNTSYLNYETQRGSVKIAAMPLFEQPLSNLRVSFDYKMSTAYSATGAAAVLELGYISNDDFTTFQSMQSWNAVTTTQSVEMTLNELAAAAPAGSRLAFKFSGTHNGTGTSSYTNVACGIDNIVVEEIPTMLGVTASNVTANSVDLNWDVFRTCAGVNYTVTYGSESTEVSTTNTTISGLTPNTEYTFEVSSSCAAPGEPTVSVTVITLQIPATLPYATGFETTDDNAMWTVLNGTNGWYFGTAANNGGEQGLYISNNNGAENAYTNSGTGVQWSYAYRLLNISEAGWYNFSFDWKANGESSYDYLRAWLAPSNVSLNAATSPTNTTSASGYINTTPEGWIDLNPNGGKMNLQTTWQSVESLQEIATAGNYNLVLMWVNDNSGGSQPPVAVDNVSVVRNAFKPTELTAENITSTGATLTWTRDTRNAGAETYTIKKGTETVATGIDANSYVVTLTPNTDYTFTLFAETDGDASDAENVSLRVNEYPTEAGKMVNLAYSYDFTAEADEPSVSFYYGMGATRTATAVHTLTAATATEATFTNTTSANWAVDGPVTVVFLNHNANVLNFTPAITYLCPAVITDTDPVEQTINTGAYTWTTPENHEYTYGPLKGTTLGEQVEALVGSYHDTVLNVGGCDSIYRHLNLTLYPTYEVTLTDEFCQGTTYTVGTDNYTASVQKDVHLTAAGGADSLVHVDLHMNAAPVALINNNVNNTINSYCEGFDLTLTATAVEGASAVAGATFEWEDATTAATRTVNPLSTTTNVYTLIATDPVTGCVSLEPATLTVTTTPVPVLTVTADREAICVGQNSAVLTVTDANNIAGVNFRWYNANTNTVAGTGATLTVNPTETTNYYVVAEGDCEVQSAPITITVNELPVVTVAATPAVICQNDMISLTATSVDGYSYSWNTNATTAETTVAAAITGNYTVTVTDQNGCVNEFTTNNVTVNPVYELNDAQSVCYLSNPYTWKAGNQTAMNITEDGNYNYTFQTVNGCDSLVHLTFAFEQMSVNNTYREVCQNTDVTWGPTTYPAVQESATLTYELGVGDIDPDNNVLDCPAQYNLILTVNPVKATSFDQVACDSYTWNLNGETYTADATPSVTLATTKGCDSVVTMNLTVNYQNTGVDTQVACDRYEWPLNHNIYTESNTTAQYTLTGANAFGCDSVVTLNLTVNYKQENTVFYRECDDTVFVWNEGNGLTYNRNVNPEDNITWNLTTADPTVTTVDGCDSILRLHLVMNYVSDTLNWVNIEECDSWYIDTVGCDGQIARAYYDESNDSIIVRTRNAATGRDQISRIHLVINRSEHQTVPMTACVPYTWDVAQGISHEIVSDTVLSQELETASGCKLIKVLRFTAKYPTEKVTPVTLCQNGSWTDGNSVVYDMANYELGENDRVQWNQTVNVAGCDSIDYVVFTVNPVYNVTAEETYCESEFDDGPIVYANPNNAAETVELTIPGALNQVAYTNTVTANWTTAQGCDSIVTINYTVNPSVTEDVTVQNCYTYTWNGREYNTLGLTEDTFETVSALTGCDSTAILHLTLTDTVIGVVTIEACGEYTYNNVTYRESKTFIEESGMALSGCDSVTHFVYNLTPRVMKDVYVVANAPYTWDNNVEYSTSVENIYYDATEPGGCDSILVLHLTMEQPIVICENELPYTTTFGVTLTEDTTNYTETINGVLYDIDYTVNHNTVETVTVDNACDSYEWHGVTYTESGNYTFETINAKGCDSTATLALTVNVSTDSVLTAVACDTYTWSGITFTASADTTIVGMTNAKGCDSTATLHLTINVNEGTAETAVACDTYTWQYMTDPLTTSGNYSVDYTDGNGCTGAHTLALTVNYTAEGNTTVVRNEASTYYNGNYYADIAEANNGLPYTFDVTLEEGAANGCDSIDHVTLYVTRGTVHDENYNMCGNFTWNRNNHTYAWIDAAERAANGNALYKDITDATAPVYIHTGENPIAMELDANGVATNTYVLWLNMIEANYFTVDLGDIMLSDVASMNVNPGDSLDTQTLDFSEYITNKQGEPNYSDTIHHTSTYYCENVVTYTANLIYNYDTVAPVTICDTTTWTDPVDDVHTVTIGAANGIDYITTDNWHHHVVVNVTARTTSDPQVVTACDTYTWTAGNGETYTTSGNYNWNDDVNCTTETMQLTINTNAGSTETATECDTYTWNAPDGEAYTYTEGGVKTVQFTDANGCVGTATLNLTINTNAGTTETETACDSYTWQYMPAPLTESDTYTVNYTDANGCEGVHTLNLTINAHQDAEFSDAACVTYTWADNNDAVYTTSGDYTRPIMDANNCSATETLHLTIYDTVNTSSERFEYGNGFTFHGSFYTPRLDGTDSIYTIVYDTVDANNCAIKDTLTLHVSQFVYTYINKVECGSYTWTAAENGNEHTYRTLTAEEATANPTAAFFDVTANAAVANMQQYVNNGNIYVLNLTLNEPVVNELPVINVPMSQLAGGNYTTTDGFNRVIDCSEAITAGQTMLITKDFSMDEEGMGPFTACDSVVRYSINVIYNYVTDNPVTLCAATTYEVVAGDVRTITTGTNTLTYTLNAGQANEEFHTVVVTNKARTNSTPQVVTACDTYTWTAGDAATYTTSGSYTWNNNDTAICSLETLDLTINTNSGITATEVACDSYTWTFQSFNATSSQMEDVSFTYTEGGVKTETYVDANGCEGTATLNLTINVNAGVEETVAACDSYSWTYATEPLTESNTYTETFTDGNGCEGTATLNLTINTNEGIDETEASCYSYTWTYQSFNAVSNQMEDVSFTYTEGGVKTETYVDANGCVGTATLNLTINGSESIDTAFWFGEGSYRYTGIFTTATAHMYMPGDYAGIVETVNGVTANGCDSIYNITLHVGNNYTLTDAVRSCNTYTWARNEHTYIRLTDEQRAANPTALYFDQTANEVVLYNPVVVEPQVNDYANEYMLDLTLDAVVEENVTVNVPVSAGSYTFDADHIYNFAMSHDAGREFEGDVITDEIHLNNPLYCDSIVYLTVNVVNNYVFDSTIDLCYSVADYTWEGQTLTLDANPDTANTYYMYSANDADTTVHWIKLNQHPIQYVTERRTECESYTWNGRPFTESTSGATMNLTDQYGCDSTVTLVLTINHATNQTLGTEDAPVEACDGYTWTLGDGTELPEKIEQSGTYTWDYTTAEGCESHDTLYLLVNASTHTEEEVTACDSYTWDAPDGQTYVMSASEVKLVNYTNEYNCASTATLDLTINLSSADAVVEAACDSYTWPLNDVTYTESGVYTAVITNVAGCDSTVTLTLTIDNSNGTTVVTACDSYTWTDGDGLTYTESGIHEYTSNVANACGSLTQTLDLTINHNSGHMDEVAICSSNLPAAGYVWNGNSYDVDGEYYYDYTDDNNCLSQDTLKLTIGNVRSYGRVYVENCGPYTWDVTGETFTESTEASTIMEGANAVGCDSVLMLYLTVYEQPVVNETEVVCNNEPYLWHGQTLETTGEYTATAPYDEHCDSLYVLNLTVNEITYSTTDVTACDSYEWNGETYTENGVYTFNTTNAAGCDSVATLNLTINANSGHVVSEAVCDSYEWHGVTYTESGEYYYNYSDANNCASEDTLLLTIANSENNTVTETACDSYTWTAGDGETYTESGTYVYNYTTDDNCTGVKTLVLTVNSSNSSEEIFEACDSYDWNGETYTESGVYTYTTTNVAGCDSIVTLNLKLNKSTEGEETLTACNYYTWNGTTYTTSGDYTYNTTNAAGCDSTATLHLTVNSNDAVTINEEACDSYTWNGAIYTQSGDYTYAGTNAAGCDSVVTLHLTIKNGSTNAVQATACNSYVWTEGDGQTYTESGVYTYTTNAANGCDSVVTLTLTINTPINTTETVEACDSYTWNNQTYTTSGVYTNDYVDVNGCDATATLNLTVKASTSSSEIVTACGAYEWNGQTYTQTGVYTYTTTNAAGCDSTAILSLVINQSVSSSETATACDSYEWNGTTYTESGVYTFNSTTIEGCDSIATLLLTIKNSTNNAETVTACDSYTWNNTEYVQSGDYTYNYTNAAGCASVDTLHLTVNASTEETVNATACDSYTWSTGNGQTYTTSGTYTYNTTNANNCAHVVTLALTINNASTSTENVAVCGSYTWNGQTYAQSGVYTYNTTNAAGCDSVATLILSINQPYATTVNQTACDSYEWNGQTYTTSGNYTYNYTASNNCDSAVTLVLTINQSKTNSFNANVCAGGEYTWNNQSYTTAGQYEQTLTARNGCDSVVTMNLTVVQPMNTTESDTACVSYTWSNSQTYTQSGTYTANFTDVNGCAATATLNLIVNQPINTVETVANCVNYEWNGQTYTESGTYTSSITDANGCAATATLNLTINPATSEVLTVAACDSYTWVVNDSVIGVYTETPGYQLATPTINENGCPHTVYLLLTINNSVTVDTAMTVIGSYTWHGETYSESGTYTYTSTGSNGCDSTTILNLTVQPAITYYTVTLTSANPGMGIVSDGGEVAENTLFTAVATANDGYHFVAWIDGNGDTVSELETYQFVVTSDVNLTAHFAFTPIFYNVTAQVVTVMQNGDTVIGEHAQVLGAGEFESGSTVTLTAVADSGYHFVCWSNGRNTATITFTVTDNIELIAYFEQDQQTPPQAIDETDMSDVVIFSVDTRIIVRGVEGNDVYVFDVNGRMLDHKLDVNGEVEFRVATTGVYLVKVGNAPAKRVLVVR